MRAGLRLTFGGLIAVVVLILSGDLIDAVVDGRAQDVAEGIFTVVGATAGVAALAGIVMAILSESSEQALRGPVPFLADVLPPLGFIVAGIGLLMIGRSALRLQHTLAPA